MLFSFTDKVEPLSLDEAYLDVTRPKRGPASGTLQASWIKEEISSKTGLTASAGVSFNKFLAKTASGMNKPDGLTVITPREAEAFVEALPIETFFGVGLRTIEHMHTLGIYTGRDLRGRSLDESLASQGRTSARPACTTTASPRRSTSGR